MGKKTYAAVMKQLSNKKSTYEKGIKEAQRVGNPSGVRDYERRLAKLNAGMDELFQSQETSKQDKTVKKMMREGGMTKDQAMYALGGRYSSNMPQQVSFADGGLTQPKYVEYKFLKSMLPQQLTAEQRAKLSQLETYVAQATQAGWNPSDGFNEDGSMVGGTVLPIAEVAEGRTPSEMLATSSNTPAPVEDTAPAYQGPTASIDPRMGSANGSRNLTDESNSTDGGYNKSYGAFSGGPSRLPADDISSQKANTVIDSEGNMFLEPVAGGRHIVMTKELLEFKRRDPKEFANFKLDPDRLATYENAKGSLFFDKENYTKGTFDESGMLRGKGEDSPYANVGARIDAQNNIGASTPGAAKYAPRDASEFNMDFGAEAFTTGATPPSAATSDPAVTIGAGLVGPTAPTTPTTTAGTTAVAGTAGLNAEQARRQSEAFNLGMRGASGMTGDGTGYGTGVQLPGLNTSAGAGPLPGVFGIAEQMGAFAPTATEESLDVNLKSGEEVVTGGGVDSTSSTSRGTGGSPYLGMAAGAAAQLLPYVANLRDINKLEGPIDAPMLRAQTINTDLQVGNQLAAARNAAARSMASIDANVSNPAVAAAMKRANQRVAAGQEMQILSNEASQEMQLRNQNINQLTNVLNQNAGIQAANEQRRIDFGNERLGARAQVRQNMAGVLGGAFQDFQNRAADLRRFELLSKLDEYGVIGRNNIDDIIGK